MTSMPAMTSPSRLARTDFARSITLRDRTPAAADDYPIHILGTVELDGQQIPGVKDVELNYGLDTATHVVLHLYPTLCDVATPFLAADGEHVQGGIAGLPVLAVAAPRDVECPWEYDEETDTMACSFYVASVVFA